MVSPTSLQTLCPGPASLLFFGCRKNGVAIHAYNNSTSGKEQPSPPPRSSKLDAMNKATSSEGGDDRDGAAQVSGTESSSVAAGKGEGEELSAVYCATRLPAASDKTKSNPSVEEEGGREAGGDKRFPFGFSARNCLKSSPSPPEMPPTSQLPSQLPPPRPQQQPAGKTRPSDSLVGSSSLGIARPGKARKSINKENHHYRTKEEAEQDADKQQELEEGRLEQRQRKEPQPRPGSSTANRCLA